MQIGLFCHEIGLFCHGGMASNDAFSYGASADAYQGQSCNHAYEAIMPSPHQGMLHHALAGMTLLFCHSRRQLLFCQGDRCCQSTHSRPLFPPRFRKRCDFTILYKFTIELTFENVDHIRNTLGTHYKVTIELTFENVDRDCGCDGGQGLV